MMGDWGAEMSYECEQQVCASTEGRREEKRVGAWVPATLIFCSHILHRL